MVYASRRTGLVTLTREGRLPFCITPEDPGAFVEALNHHLPGGVLPARAG
jgi:hypothetical protein